MKIVVITGSPRKKGNSFAMTQALMDGVRIPLERSAALLQWKLTGEVLVPGVLNEEDIDKTDGCSQAAELAHRF